MTIEIDHIGLSVSDYPTAKSFYAEALKPLRITMLMEFPAGAAGNYATAGFGADSKPFFWISGEGKTSPHAHIAIRAESRQQVDAFYAAAIAAGGKDNGEPGVREHYHPNYYGAFVLDPEGHNIEAVCHAAPGRRSRRASGRQRRNRSQGSPPRASPHRVRARARRRRLPAPPPPVSRRRRSRPPRSRRAGRRRRRPPARGRKARR